MQPEKRFLGEFDLSLIPTMEEFDRRYQDTYMLVNVPSLPIGEDIYLYKGSGGGKCYFYNDVYGEIQTNKESECKVRAFFPPVGLFNDVGHKRALVGFKYPARMNKRSMCDKNFKILDPIYSKLFGRNSKITFDVLRQAVKAQEVLISTACSLLEHESYSVALNGNYMLSVGSKNETYLWYRDLPIGVNQENIFKVDSHYFQEFKDYLIQSGQSQSYLLMELE